MKKRIVSLLLSLLLLMSFIITAPIYAATVPTLSVESKTVSPGEQFSIAVKLQNSTNVYNGNFTLQYDSTKLSVESYSIGSIYNGHTSMCNTDYQSAGNLIRFTFSGAYALKGDGTLVTLTFKVKASASGTASLQFNAYKIYDANGTSMSPTASNGSVTISSVPTVKPQLSVTAGSVSAGRTISVPVKISNSSGVYNGNFTLQYDSTKLSVESYSKGSIFNGHTVMCNTDYQSAGNLIRFTFSGAYALKGDGTLVTITFKAKTSVSGTASLQFTTYKIYDANGTSMNPTATNGSVTINPIPTKTLTSISVYNNPSKITYYIGDTFSSSGLKIKATYSDGSTETLSSGFSVSSPTMSTSGSKSVTVTYSGKTTSFNITVNTPSITLSSTSKSLAVGDTATLTATTTPSGQSVTWSSSNTIVATVSSGTITAKAKGSATITAKFTYNGTTYSKPCSVTVSDSDPVPTSLSVSSNPTKTTYEIGESLNTSGLKLKLTYSDGSYETITSGFTTSGFSSATAGTKTVTVKYNNLSTTFTITVKEKTVIDENAPQIVIESKRVTCGQSFTVDVTVKNNPGFSYLELTPAYSDKLTLASITNGELISDLTKGKQYVWVADEDVLTDGKLMTFNFSTDSNVEPGEYQVGFIVRSCVNGDEKIIDIAVENAIIEIVDFTYGDANGDGAINGQDVVRIKKYLANYDYDTETSTTEISAGADANGDGMINGQDVVRLKKYLANYDYETETSTIVLGPQN